MTVRDLYQVTLSISTVIIVDDGRIIYSGEVLNIPIKLMDRLIDLMFVKDNNVLNILLD